MLNICFCVPRKKESNLGLERHKGEYMTTTFSFKLTWQEGGGYQVLCSHQDPQTSADLPLKHTHTWIRYRLHSAHTKSRLLWGIQKPNRSNSNENLSAGHLKNNKKTNTVGYTYKDGLWHRYTSIHLLSSSSSYR